MNWKQIKEEQLKKSMKLYDKNVVLQTAIDFLKDENYDQDEIDEDVGRLNGEIAFAFPRNYTSFDDGEAVLTMGYDTSVGVDEQIGLLWIENQLFAPLIDADIYFPQIMESQSSFYFSSDIEGFPSTEAKAKKEVAELISIVMGNSLTDPNSKVYTKISTKDCLDAIEEKYNIKCKKRTAKFNFGKIVVREFDESYAVLEYNNRIIHVSVSYMDEL